MMYVGSRSLFVLRFSMSVWYRLDVLFLLSVPPWPNACTKGHLRGRMSVHMGTQAEVITTVRIQLAHPTPHWGRCSMHLVYF